MGQVFLDIHYVHSTVLTMIGSLVRQKLKKCATHLRFDLTTILSQSRPLNMTKSTTGH